MPVYKYRVRLTTSEYVTLTSLVNDPESLPRLVMHARVLLLADEQRNKPRQSEQAIAERLSVNVQTVHSIRRRFAMEGLDSAVNRKKRDISTIAPRISPEIKTRIYALSLSTPPHGKSRWTYRLLAHHAQAQNIVERISHETIGQLLKKTSDSAGDNWHNGVKHR